MMSLLNIKIDFEKVTSLYRVEKKSVHRFERLLNFYDFYDIAIFRAKAELRFTPIKFESNLLELNQKQFFNRCSKCKHHRETVTCLLCGYKVCSRYCAFRTNEKKDSRHS